MTAPPRRGTPAPGNRLLLVTGDDWAGKSTIMRALLPHTRGGASVDAEDIGQTNPFFVLLRRNVAGLVPNY